MNPTRQQLDDEFRRGAYGGIVCFAVAVTMLGTQLLLSIGLGLSYSPSAVEKRLSILESKVNDLDVTALMQQSQGLQLDLNERVQKLEAEVAAMADDPPLPPFEWEKEDVR